MSTKVVVNSVETGRIISNENELNHDYDGEI